MNETTITSGGGEYRAGDLVNLTIGNRTERLRVIAATGTVLTVRPAEWWRWRLAQVRTWLRRARWRMLAWVCR